MNARRPGVRAAAMMRAAVFASASVLALVLLASAPPCVDPAAAQGPEWTALDSTIFEIYQDDRPMGTEEFRAYKTNDTLIVGSVVRMTGLAEDSILPIYKNTTFIRRADSSWPLMFLVNEIHRDTTRTKSINCAFNDTTVVVYHEADGRGLGTVVALPPGRIYLLEPGIYSQVQTLVGDFARSKQNKRKQPVLIPSAKTVIDVHLARGPRERLGQEGYVVETTRVDLTDGFVQLVAWVDGAGRMWKLEAAKQGLRVERSVPAGQPAATTGKPKKAKK